MNNGSYRSNISSLIDDIQTANEEGRLFQDALTIYILDFDDSVILALDKQTGLFLFTEAGTNKSNRRQYIKYNGYMVVSYAFHVIADAIINNKNDILNNLISGYEINHINGDTLNNNLDNLEVVSPALNKAHSYLMHSINIYCPELVEIIGKDCQGHAMHRFCGSLSDGISCREIEKYNEIYNDKIKAYKPKDNSEHWQDKSEMIRVLIRLTNAEDYIISPNGNYLKVKPLAQRLAALN